MTWRVQHSALNGTTGTYAIYDDRRRVMATVAYDDRWPGRLPSASDAEYVAQAIARLDEYHELALSVMSLADLKTEAGRQLYTEARSVLLRLEPHEKSAGAVTPAPADRA